MCPQTCLWNLLDAMSRNDRVAVHGYLGALKNWNLSGGFMPTIDCPPGQSVAHFIVRRVIAEAGPTVDDQSCPAEPDATHQSRQDVKQEFKPHYIHEAVEAVETWCEEDGCESSRAAWEREPAKRIDLKAGDHVLLPSDWIDDDFDGPMSEVAVVQREFPPDVADGDLRYYVVTPLFDDYREAKLSANVLHWGRMQWLAENQTMGSGSHGAEEGGDDDE